MPSSAAVSVNLPLLSSMAALQPPAIFDAEQGKAQVAESVEYAGELGLIPDQSLQDGDGMVGRVFPVGLNPQAAEAIRPVRVESTRHDDAIGVRLLPFETRIAADKGIF